MTDDDRYKKGFDDANQRVIEAIKEAIIALRETNDRESLEYRLAMDLSYAMMFYDAQKDKKLFQTPAAESKAE